MTGAPALPNREQLGYFERMKISIAVAVLLLAFALPRARAQDADDRYVVIYSLMQQADSLQSSGQPRQALDEFVEMQSDLQRFQKMFPDWHPKIVSYRLNYLAQKITEVTAELPVTNAPPPVVSTAGAVPPVPPAADTNFDARLGALRGQIQQLQADNTTLAAKLKEALAVQPATVDPRELASAREQMRSLMKENDLLQVSLSQAKSGASAGPETDALKQAQAALAAQTERADKLARENESLQSRMKSLSAGADAAEALREENALLKKQLAAAAKPAPVAPASQLEAQISTLTAEVDSLRARLAVDEAQVIPYTPEELALFRQPAPLPANSGTEKKSVDELPEGSAVLVAEAQTYFAGKQYDKAEADYLEILNRDRNNGLALANLAAIELQQGKLDDAEKHITAALAQSPDDAYNLSISGYLKIRQEKYDDAVGALSRAAKLDPQNPVIENYLGVALGHKGLREQAETALRKAVEIAPDYGAAHNNLAVIYINEQPPMPELARLHYQKALAAGEPRNPDLEKILAEKGAPVDSQ
jgi:tetratricopeptide (TPR) repeat protein